MARAVADASGRAAACTEVKAMMEFAKSGNN